MFRFLFLIACLFWAAQASASTIVSYVAGSGFIAPKIADPNVTATDITTGPRITNLATGATFDNWLETSLADALANDDFVTWSVSAKPGFRINNPAMSVGIGSEGADSRETRFGPRDLVLQAAFDGGAFQTIFTGRPFRLSGYSVRTNLGLTFPASVKTMNFRVVAWNAKGRSGSLFFENRVVGPGQILPAIDVRGTLEPVPAVVPSPASGALMLAFALPFVLHAKRRRP